PISAWISPAATSRSTPRSACTPPYQCSIPRSSRIAGSDGKLCPGPSVWPAMRLAPPLCRGRHGLHVEASRLRGRVEVVALLLEARELRLAQVGADDLDGSALHVDELESALPLTRPELGDPLRREDAVVVIHRAEDDVRCGGRRVAGVGPA